MTSLLTRDVIAAPPHSLLQRPRTALTGPGLPRGLGPGPSTGVRGGSAPSHAAPSSSSCRCYCGARPTTTRPAPGTCSRRSPVSFGGAQGRGFPGQGRDPGAGGAPRGCPRPWWVLGACGAVGSRVWLGPCGGAEFPALGELLPPSHPGWIPNPAPEISHESPGSSQCLLEHLLTRLQSSSCHVKLKVGSRWGGDGVEAPRSREGQL